MAGIIGGKGDIGADLAALEKALQALTKRVATLEAPAKAPVAPVAKPAEAPANRAAEAPKEKGK